MSVFATLVWRDLRRAWGSGGIGLVVAFFLLTVVLFPFAVGPDPRLLARVGGGVIWTATLLAALLPIERLVRPDLAAGVFDQLALRGVSLTLAMLARVVAHWLTFGPPILLAGVVAAGLLGIPAATLLRIEVALLVGSPALAALAVATAALVATLRSSGALAGLVMLPFAVPVLIFGAGSVGEGAGALKLLGAVSLVLLAGCPWVAATAIRIARE